MHSINNFYIVSKKLACSGQPKESAFSMLAKQGFDAIINLAMPDSDGALANEVDICNALNIDYTHIPVKWEQPTIEDMTNFSTHMQRLSKQKVLVHCAYNWRASCFVYLYQKHMLKLNEQQSRQVMDAIWQPKNQWLAFINTVNHFYHTQTSI